MKSEVDISVVIPTCNRPELLAQTLRCIHCQTVKPREIIIVNNGSEKLDLSSLSGNWSPSETGIVKVYNIVPFAGVSQARNFGASLSKSHHLAFIDDDDLWGDEYLEKSEYALNDGYEFVISRIDTLVDGEIRPLKNPLGAVARDILFIRNPGVGGSNIVISRELFFQLGGYNPALPTSEDKSLAIEALRVNAKIIVLPENQAIARKHQSSQRLTGAASMAEGTFQFYRIYCECMTLKQKIINLKKIYLYRYRADESLKWGLMYLIYNLIHRLMGKK